MVSVVLLGALAMASVGAGRPAGESNRNTSPIMHFDANCLPPGHLEHRQDTRSDGATTIDIPVVDSNQYVDDGLTPGAAFTVHEDGQPALITEERLVALGAAADDASDVGLVAGSGTNEDSITIHVLPPPSQTSIVPPVTTVTLSSARTIIVSVPTGAGEPIDPLALALTGNLGPVLPDPEVFENPEILPGSSVVDPPGSQSDGVAGGRPSGPKPPQSTAKNGSESAVLESKSFGVSYAPYKADHGCKSAEQISDDFHRFEGEYSLVRIYGTDCDQVPAVYTAAKEIGVKLFLGIWDINQAEGEASKIIEGINGDWGQVHAVSVGNELVNNKEASPQEVISAMHQVRSTLRSAGYQGPVVSVDTFNAVEANPELCEQSDFCAINAHAFFDESMSAEEAGDWLLNTVERVKAALAEPMQVVVTETGWPTEGEANGKAQPGLENQRVAIESIKQAFAENPGDVVLFSAYNDLWKQSNANQFAAEKYWGIGGAISRCDE
jgi:exo-beta-1,3-glucanase (GH17 family)